VLEELDAVTQVLALAPDLLEAVGDLGDDLVDVLAAVATPDCASEFQMA
jgi:hypothetical protein